MATLSVYRALSLIVLLAQLRFGLGGFNLEGLIPVPNEAESEHDINTLKTGMIGGTLAKDESRVIWFGAEKRHGRFPDFLVMLHVLNRHGDADVHCAPAPWLTSLGRNASASFYAWRSIHSQDTDELFLSAKSKAYQGGEMSVAGNKKNIVAFACTVTGVAWEATEFKFDLDLSYYERKLVDEEASAIKEIYEECCQEHNSCLAWRSNSTETNEDNFVASNGQNVEVDFCHREGSLCSRNGNLMRLDMRNFGLQCSLPVEQFTKMQRLVKLDLDGNYLTGDVAEIVGKIGSLSDMARLSLRNNRISGQLDGLESYCPVFGKNRLSYLDLSSNRVGGELVPCMFSKDDTPSSLKELRLKSNVLTGPIPDAFTSDSSLESLTLSNNDINGRIPDSLGSVLNLRVLDLQYNSMAGPIPDKVGNIPALYMLAGTGNYFTALPQSWSSQHWHPPPGLKLVEMARNDLQGEFPTGLGNAPSLLGLDIGQNQLSGVLDVADGQFSSLLLLNISFNTFQGQIPEAFGEIGVFKDISNNAIPRIQPSFDLRFNQFDGEVPKFFYPSVTPDITATRVFLAGNKGLTCENPDELRYTGVNCKPYDEANYIEDFGSEEDWEETAPEQFPAVNPDPVVSVPRDDYEPATPRRVLPPVTVQRSVPSPVVNTLNVEEEEKVSKSSSHSKAAGAWGGALVALLLVVVVVVGVVVFRRVRKTRSSFAGETTYVPPEEEGFGYALMDRGPRKAEETVPLTAPGAS